MQKVALYGDQKIRNFPKDSLNLILNLSLLSRIMHNNVSPSVSYMIQKIQKAMRHYILHEIEFAGWKHKIVSRLTIVMYSIHITVFSLYSHNYTT